MAEADVNSSDKESYSESSLELEIGSDGTICPFMFEPQHGTSSVGEVDSDTAQDQPEMVESEVGSGLGLVCLFPYFSLVLHLERRQRKVVEVMQLGDQGVPGVTPASSTKMTSDPTCGVISNCTSSSRASTI